MRIPATLAPTHRPKEEAAMKGHVRRRGKGWVGVYTIVDAEGKRKQKWVSGFRTRKAAEARLTEILGHVNRGTWVEPTKDDVGKFLRLWLAGRSDLLPSTRHGYEGLIRVHVIPTIGSIPMQKLSPESLNALYVGMIENGSSPRTAALVHTVIRKALSDAVANGHVARNVADLATRARSKAPEMRTWTGEQVRTFLNFIREDRLYAPVALTLGTGLRRGELLWAEMVRHRLRRGLALRPPKPH
jgi:integrase